jgi:hypothetical protein
MNEELAKNLNELGLFKFVEVNSLPQVRHEVLENIQAGKDALVEGLKRTFYIELEPSQEVIATVRSRTANSALEKSILDPYPLTVLCELLSELLIVLSHEGVQLWNVRIAHDQQPPEHICSDCQLTVRTKDGTGFDIGLKANGKLRSKESWLKEAIPLLNNMLAKSGSNERLFGIDTGIESVIVVMNQKLNQFLKGLNLDDKWRSNVVAG